VVFAVVSADQSLWENNPQFNPAGGLNSRWGQVSPGSFASVSAAQNSDGNPVVFAVVSADQSLWENNPQFNPAGDLNSRWLQVSPGSFSSISATRKGSGNPALFAVPSDFNVWGYNSGSLDNGWAQLT
jgi:hypothetical protein